MWGKPIPSNMQDFSCTLALGQTTILRDSRDGNTYKVAKLKDNQCWMTENLRLTGRTLIPADSDVASNFTLPASNTSGFHSSYRDTAQVYVDSTYGGYYTWYAATAGEGTEQKVWDDILHSICPKGWRLPNRYEYKDLAAAYGSEGSTVRQGLMSEPANFVFSGDFYNGSLSSTYEGLYWTATSKNEYEAYNFNLGEDLGGPLVDINYSSKYIGLPMRCVSRQ